MSSCLRWTIAAIAAWACIGPAAAQPTPASLNPYAAALFARDPVLHDWALRRYDRNRDGWLTLYEAQEAATEFKAIADSDRDGRVTVREFEEGREFVRARW